ncbi:hypothetical protein C0991_010434 [Blastosporella zonata]|nr:hypothetical protein C0991_010434 [Blastosporella zonata]
MPRNVGESSPTPTLDGKGEPIVPRPHPEEVSKEMTPSDDVIIVDWDGPDDPANPKNTYHEQRSVHL